MPAVHRSLMSAPQSDPGPRAWLLAALARFERPLVSYALSLLKGDLEQARDVVQDVFLRLSQQVERPDRQSVQSQEVETLAPWLFTVCRNRVIDVCRKNSRLTTMDTEVFDALPDETTGPDTALSNKEDSHRLHRLIAGLPPKQRDVLRLKFLGGLSYNEIAEATGLTTGNIGWLIHQAVQSLRSQWASDVA